MLSPIIRIDRFVVVVFVVVLVMEGPGFWNFIPNIFITKMQRGLQMGRAALKIII